jgi:hypothetical protein
MAEFDAAFTGVVLAHTPPRAERLETGSRLADHHQPRARRSWYRDPRFFQDFCR